MGHRELEAALRRDGEANARAIWQRAEAGAAVLGTEIEGRLQREQQRARQRIAADTAALIEESRVAAQHQAQFSRLEVEQRLAQRLKGLAEGLLESLSQAGGGGLFAQLAAEIPEHPWQLVKVHPRDLQAARAYFPQAEVVPLEGISGGLIVQDQQGRMVISNTLEKRLAHLWAELLPKLMAELRQRVKKDEAVA